jgi:ABC-2 type transport system ATP-binding protein
MTSLIHIKRLSKVFQKDTALYPLDLDIAAGKLIGLVGPDGAGKTTLIRLMTALLLPTEGDVIIDGYNTKKNPQQIQDIIGYMPQKFGLYEDLTVIQNLQLYADLKGVIEQEKEETFEKLFAFTALGAFKTRLAGDLSGGMKQKLGLACALLSKPKLLLLDEPTVGVDPISRRELWQMIQNLLGEGISIVWSTAYLDEAERCAYVVVLDKGRIVYEGDPKDLTKRVEGRVFKATQFNESPRKSLMHILQQDNILDAVIQGSSLRIVTKTREEPFSGCTVIKPRFEDGFMDILGGGPKGDSALAQTRDKIVDDHKVMIEARDLTKCFGDFKAADKITFQVRRGEVFGLLGPNGAGKSTTFKMLCGLLKPTCGEAFINGVNLAHFPSEARSHIGYMAQKFSLYGNLSVMQNLKIFSGLYALENHTKKDAIDQMVEIFNFKNCLNHNANTIPLGYKQRLALACAVMHRPEVLFLDEPTSGVDPIVRREFWGHINGLVERGTTVILTTHFIDEAENCDHLGLVYQSKLLVMGTPQSLKESTISENNPVPSLEDAFITLIERSYAGKK